MQPANYSPGGTVAPAEAEQCKIQFEKLLHTENAEDLKQKITKAYTASIAFSGNELSTWLSNIMKKPATTVDNIRIVFGVYTPDYIAGHQTELSPVYEGRISAFLWPYLGNEEAREGEGKDNRIAPYNLGGLQP
jgi:hypothetical protein